MAYLYKNAENIMSSKTNERQRNKYFSYTEFHQYREFPVGNKQGILTGSSQKITARGGNAHKVSTSPVTRNANAAVIIFSPCSPQQVGKGCFRHHCLN